MAISSEAKVGIFVVVGVCLLAYMTFRLGDLKFGEPATYQVWALFDHATGLKSDAPVEMAGIPIGQVRSISLYQGRAKVELAIREEVALPADSLASIRVRGVLGDKYVAVEQGNPSAPALKPGDQLANTMTPTDLDQVMSRVGEVADNIKEITDSLKVSLASDASQRNISDILANLQAITASLKESVASPSSQENISQSLANLRQLTDGLNQVVGANQDRINRILVQLDGFTGDLSEVTRANKEALGETLQNFRTASRAMETTMTSLTSVLQKIDRGDGTLGALVNDKSTISDLNASLASLKEITQKIEKGEGTLGKLVNDDTTVDRMNDTLEGINDYLAQNQRWQLFVEYRGEYLFHEEAARSTLNVRLQPRADKFYLLGIVTDPIGQRSESEYISTAADGTVSRSTEVKFDRNELKFNAQIGRRFHNLALRAGLFETTGGVALDYYMFQDRVRISAAAYDFNSSGNPHLRVAADYYFWENLYVTAGAEYYNDSDDEAAATMFMGAGLSFGDQDMKTLLTMAPMP